MKFIHLSDLHFHRSNAHNKGALSALDFITDNYKQHGLIVTGDITDDGHEKQYDNAYSALRPWKGRIHICPGNHDYGAVGNLYSKERARRFDEKLSIPLEQGGTFLAENHPVVQVVHKGSAQVMFIALDTNLETNHPFDFACGEVGERQLRAIYRLINAPQSSEFVKVLFMHHHPFVHNDPFMELQDARELMRTIYGKVDLLLFGHKHVSRMWTSIADIPYVLAADDTPGKDWAREIRIDSKGIHVQDIRIA